jgi:hypothetical protein
MSDCTGWVQRAIGRPCGTGHLMRGNPVHFITDLIDNIVADGRSACCDIRTSSGVQSWRFTLDSATDTVHASHGDFTAVLAVLAPPALDTAWLAEFYRDRGIDEDRDVPPGLLNDADCCAQCGDAIAWCPLWGRRWPQISADRDNK